MRLPRRTPLQTSICKGCGVVITERKRRPCKRCGSINRVISVHAEDRLSVADTA